MQILFYEQEMNKNIEFTNKINSMNYLKGYKIFFDDFPKDKWERVPDPKMNIERFLSLMDGASFFVGKLQIGEDNFFPIRYSINVQKGEDDKLFEMICDLTGKNYFHLYDTYKNIYDRDFFDKIKI